MTEDIDEVFLQAQDGAYFIANLLKDAGLTKSTSDAIRMVSRRQ